MFLKLKNDQGSALASTIIVMVVVSIIAAMLATNLLSSFTITQGADRGLTAQTNSDSGLDVAYLAVQATPCGVLPTKSTAAEEAKGIFYELSYKFNTTDAQPCLSASRVTIKATGYATSDKASPQAQEATYGFENLGDPTLPDTKLITLYKSVGDLTLNKLTTGSGATFLRKGNFTATDAEITGDVTAFEGNITLNNTAVYGDIYASGSITLTGTTHVYGSVTTTGGNVSVTDATIDGAINVQTAAADAATVTVTGAKVGTIASRDGGVTVTNSTVNGLLNSSGPVVVNTSTVTGKVSSSFTGAFSTIDSVFGGGVDVNGYFNTFKNGKVTGDIISHSTTTGSVFAPTGTAKTTATGFIRLRGPSVTLGSPAPTMKKNGSTPITALSSVYNSNSNPNGIRYSSGYPPIIVPKAEYPAQSLSPFSTPSEWADYNPTSGNWTSAGWSFRTLSVAECNWTNPGVLNSITSQKNKTVLDARPCAALPSGLTTAGVKANLQGDITILLNPQVATNFSGTTFSSFSGADRVVNIVVPDTTPDRAATCAAGDKNLNLAGNVGSPAVSGFIYTPCSIDFGVNAALDSTIWQGQVYSGGRAGETTTIGGGTSVAKLVLAYKLTAPAKFYVPMDDPSFSIGKLTSIFDKRKI